MHAAAYLGGGLLVSVAFHAWLAAQAVASVHTGLGTMSGRWLFWLLLWPLGLVLWLVELRLPPAAEWRAPERDDTHGRIAVRAEHLIEHLAIAEVEARELVADPLAAVPALPFGHLNPAWQKFVACMSPAHELWSFGGELAGPAGAMRIFEGYAMVQGGEPVECWFTADFKLGDAG